MEALAATPLFTERVENAGNKKPHKGCNLVGYGENT